MAFLPDVVNPEPTWEVPCLTYRAGLGPQVRKKGKNMEQFKFDVVKNRYPTATQLCDGIEFLASDTKDPEIRKHMKGWSIIVSFEFFDTGENDEYIEDFEWWIRKPANGKKRRRIRIGSEQEGLVNLYRVPDQAQPAFQRYTGRVWNQKIEAASKEMDKRIKNKECTVGL